MDPNVLKTDSFYLWLAIGGQAVVLLALVLHVALASGGKVTAVVAGSLGGLSAGIGAGVILMGLMGYHWKASNADQPMAGPGSAGAPPPGVVAAPPPAGEAAPAAKGGGGGGGRGPGPRRGPEAMPKLLALVGKVYLFADKPVAIPLTAEQRQEVARILADIPAKESLTEEEAKVKLDGLLKVLEPHQEMIELLGFSWTGPMTIGGPPTPQGNPFRDLPFKDQLQGVLERLKRN